MNKICILVSWQYGNASSNVWILDWFPYVGNSSFCLWLNGVNSFRRKKEQRGRGRGTSYFVFTNVLVVSFYFLQLVEIYQIDKSIFYFSSVSLSSTSLTVLLFLYKGNMSLPNENDRGTHLLSFPFPQIGINTPRAHIAIWKFKWYHSYQDLGAWLYGFCV